MDVTIYCQRKKMQRDYHTDLLQQSAWRAIDGDDQPGSERNGSSMTVNAQFIAGVFLIWCDDCAAWRADVPLQTDVLCSAVSGGRAHRLNSEWIKIVAMPDTKDGMHAAGYHPSEHSRAICRHHQSRDWALGQGNQRRSRHDRVKDRIRKSGEASENMQSN